MSGNLYGKGMMTSTSYMTENKLTPSTIAEINISISEIVPRTIYITGLTMSNSTLKLAPTNTKQLSVTISPTNADNKEITWTTENEDIATVSNSGLVTAIADGKVNIVATANDGSGETAVCVVTVATV